MLSVLAGEVMVAEAARRETVFEQAIGNWKRCETSYDRIDRHTTCSEVLDLGGNWIRHTTLDDVRKVAGERVAARWYAGHEDSSGDTVE